MNNSDKPVTSVEVSTSEYRANFKIYGYSATHGNLIAANDVAAVIKAIIDDKEKELLELRQELENDNEY